jgi:hypothetical protein
MAAVLLAVLHCGGTEPAPETKPDKELPNRPVKKPSANQLCTARCEREAACHMPGEGCMRECLGWQRSITNMRGDLMWRMLTCLDSIDCVLVEQGTAWQQCFEQMRAIVPLTPALRRFCFESARRAAVCGKRNEADQTSCRDQFRHLDDAVLEQGTACLAKPCAEVTRCFHGVMSGTPSPALPP